MTEQKTPTNWPSKASRKKSKYRQPFRAVKRRRKPLSQKSNGMTKPWSEFKHLARYKILRPFYFIEWCFEYLVYRLRRWALLDFMDQVSQFTVLVAVIIYLLGAQQRKEDRIVQNLNLLASSAQVGGGPMARKALENLNKENYFLSNLNLTNLNLKYLRLPNAQLIETKLAGSNLKKANFKESNLFFADLREVNLREAMLQEVILQGADLQGANLQRVDLQYSYLQGANLNNTNLNFANLMWADLEGSNLKNADLHGANLRGVILRGANIQGANLSSADLKNVFPIKGILPDMRGISKDLLEQVNSLYKCKNLDPELEAQLRKERPCLFTKEGCK